jgi:hypothetical protein
MTTSGALHRYARRSGEGQRGLIAADDEPTGRCRRADKAAVLRPIADSPTSAYGIRPTPMKRRGRRFHPDITRA